jgi:hypothetical protein
MRLYGHVLRMHEDRTRKKVPNMKEKTLKRETELKLGKTG